MDKRESLSSTPPGSSLLYIENLRNPSCWSECEYFYRHGQFHFLERQWEIRFLTFLNTDRNAQRKNLNRNMDILIWNMLSESIFDSGKWSNWKYANTRICIFSVWPLPEVENGFRKQISNENVHITILNFFLSVLVSIKKNKKMDFSLYFQKVKLTVLIEIFTFRSARWVPEVPNV